MSVALRILVFVTRRGSKKRPASGEEARVGNAADLHIEKKNLCFSVTVYRAQYIRVHPTPAVSNSCIPENVDQIRKA